jgi:hypothetical protein
MCNQNLDNAQLHQLSNTQISKIDSRLAQVIDHCIEAENARLIVDSLSPTEDDLNIKVEYIQKSGLPNDTEIYQLTLYMNIVCSGSFMEKMNPHKNSESTWSATVSLTAASTLNLLCRRKDLSSPGQDGMIAGGTIKLDTRIGPVERVLPPRRPYNMQFDQRLARIEDDLRALKMRSARHIRRCEQSLVRNALPKSIGPHDDCRRDSFEERGPSLSDVWQRRCQ